jgi:lysophospholipase L1-like esterase
VLLSRLCRQVAVAAAVALGFTLGLAAPAAANAGAGQSDRADHDGVAYVALGDSYAAGLGAGRPRNACGQTNGGYPALWAHSAPAPVSLRLAACAGASTGDVLAHQVRWLGPHTSLVSITVGANDLHVFAVLRACLDPAGLLACLAGNAAIDAALATTVPVAIRTLLGAVADAAPDAAVVLTGYPLPFAARGACPGVEVARALRDRANEVMARLNAVLASEARRAGVRFADVARAFAGHSLCSVRPWLIGVEGLRNGTVLHPTAAGQARGYLPAFAARVDLR